MSELDDCIKAFKAEFPQGEWRSQSFEKQKSLVAHVLDGLDSLDAAKRLASLRILQYIALGEPRMCVTLNDEVASGSVRGWRIISSRSSSTCLFSCLAMSGPSSSTSSRPLASILGVYLLRSTV